MGTEKEYLGDSVYVEYDGISLILTTENGCAGDPSNTVVLDPEVYEALVGYVGRSRIVSGDNHV